MSIITNLPAIPNRLFILFRYLLEKGEKGEDKERLSDFFTPPSLLKSNIDDDVETGQSMFDSVFKEARLMGLINESGDRIVLQEYFSKREVNRVGAKEIFIKMSEKILLDSELAEQKGQKNVAQAFAWLLMQDPSNPLMFSENQRGRIINDLGEETGAYTLSNNSRFQNLIYWARFLGYCNWMAVDQNNTYILPDPTRAILRRLPEFFKHSSKMRIMDFITALGSSCPVLDQGTVRQEVENIARPELRTEPRTVSKSTSLALRHLESRGEIKIEILSDADVVTIHSDGERLRYSHISYKG